MAHLRLKTRRTKHEGRGAIAVFSLNLSDPPSLCPVLGTFLTWAFVPSSFWCHCSGHALIFSCPRSLHKHTIFGQHGNVFKGSWTDRLGLKATQRNNAAPVPLKQKNCFGKCTWASATLGQTLQVATCSSGMFPEQLLACPAGFPNKPTTPGFVCLHTRLFLVSVCVRF